MQRAVWAAASVAMVGWLVGSCNRAPVVPKVDFACPPGTHLQQVKLERTCVHDNGIKDGPAALFYTNGKVAQTGTYRDNHRDGHWTFWQEDGALWQEGDWHDGTLAQLTPHLAPCDRGATRNGAPPPQGRAVWCQRQQPDGTWRNDGPFMSWHDDGQPQAQGVNKDGEPEGEFTMWYPDGRLKARGAYVHGKEQGLWLSWHDNGLLFIRALFEHGKEQGPWVSWWEEGSKSAEGEFALGLETGPWTFWHPNGGKSEVGSYVTGKKNGWWRRWDSDGHEQPMEEYRNGTRVGAAGPSLTAPN